LKEKSEFRKKSDFKQTPSQKSDAGEKIKHKAKKSDFGGKNQTSSRKVRLKKKMSN
jgi:hypothetical protein